jgi:uncharacterized repeat protein (TIGR01451 family)
MTTAINADGILKEDGTTPSDSFDRGAGRVYASRAAQAGFVLDETTANFEAADPSTGGDPKTLNLASFTNDECLVNCSWTRTISSTMDTSVNWTASVTGTENMTITVEPAAFDLAAGATQVITVSVNATDLPFDKWAFGQVTLTPDTADTVAGVFPVVVKPTTGVLPDEVKINTRRNAGSTLMEDLKALEITDLQFTGYGMTKADVYTTNLEEDPTNDIFAGEMYDDLSQVYYITFTVPAGAKRLVAEIMETTSPDLDMSVGFDGNGDGKPELSEELCVSATSGPMESCDLMAGDLSGAGTYWALVLNWKASSVGAADLVKLGLGIVPGSDAGNMSVDDPGAVAKATPFDLRLYWDEATMAGDERWYGVFGLGTDAGNPDNIGMVPVTLNRYADPVKKTASWMKDGDTVTLTYKLSVQPNVTGQDITYALTDTIPAGLTYVPGSLTGGAVISGNQITWSGTMTGGYRYVMSTNKTDPFCDTGFGGYVDLEGFGIKASSTITGDSLVLTAFANQNPYNFYGNEYTGLWFTDDGTVGFDAANNAASLPAPTNQDLPDPTRPNTLLAPLWQDMEIVYDAANNYGVTLANAGANTAILEFDDIQVKGDPTQTYDFEVVAFSGLGVGPEYVFAYDNISGTVGSATVGIENEDGTQAEVYAYNDATPTTLHDGLVVCFDYKPPTDPHEITYQVTVDDVDAIMEGTPYVNTVDHIVDRIGAQVEEVSHTFAIHTLFMPVVFKQ